MKFENLNRRSPFTVRRLFGAVFFFSPTGGEGVRRTDEGDAWSANQRVLVCNEVPPHPGPLPQGGEGVRNTTARPNIYRKDVFCKATSGFTMIEIALCLAIIGFALISILLVLPSGMNTQRDTRQETIINQDASELLEAIRGGARGYDDLTNYVYAISNFYGFYDVNGKFIPPIHVNGYTYTKASIDSGSDYAGMYLTNGLRIIGLLSTPEFTLGNNVSGGFPISNVFTNAYTSNHIVAYIRSFSGLAAEKPPQDNQIMREDAFSYRLLCVNAPVAVDTNTIGLSAFTRQLAGNLRELRLLFEWPQLPNGDVGGFRQTYRTTVSGQLVPTNYFLYFPGISDLYFYQSQIFTNAP